LKADALKRCGRCHRQLPATTDYFPQNKGRLGGWCKACHRGYYHEVRRKPHLTERDQLETAGQRRCTRCGEVKPMDTQHFLAVTPQRCGLSTECRACYNLRQQTRRKARAASRPPSETQTLEAQGLKRCSKCGEVKPASTEFFYASGRGPSGLGSACKVCNAIQQRERRAKHGYKPWPKKARQRAVFDDWRSAGCVVCGMKLVKGIDAHHVNPAEKDYNIARKLGQMTDAELDAELAKCVPICRNDHALVSLELRAGGDALSFEELVQMIRQKYGIIPTEWSGRA